MDEKTDINANRDQFDEGPLALLTSACKSASQLLINCRNNHKILGRIKAFDRHCNMILEDVTEFWEVRTAGKQATRKQRNIKKLFLRVVLADPHIGNGQNERIQVVMPYAEEELRGTVFDFSDAIQEQA